jgi:alcohol dehydrogenase class IV
MVVGFECELRGKPMSATILLPRILRVGAGVCLELWNVMQQMGVCRPLVITQGSFIRSGYVPAILKPLTEAGVKAGVFAHVTPDPTTDSIYDGIDVLKDGDYDCLIAIGGGSAIDSAKAISVCGPGGGKIRNYKAPLQTDRPGLPVIAIPTTAGTGSEVTKVTIITDTETDEKMLLMGIAFQPVAALVDYELTMTKPVRLTADTGIDSLTHAIEAYVSKRANPFADSMAISAMKLIAGNLRAACRDGNDRSAREAMMLGSMQAGIAFSNASVCLVHGMSRPIGAHFHVPHGLSNAMLLPEITAFSITAAPERYADCARAMGIASEACSDDEANNLLLVELRALNEDLGVPSMREWGIDSDRYNQLLPQMAQQALDSGSPGNNPRVPKVDEIIALYKNVFASNVLTAVPA